MAKPALRRGVAKMATGRPSTGPGFASPTATAALNTTCCPKCGVRRFAPGSTLERWRACLPSGVCSSLTATASRKAGTGSPGRADPCAAIAWPHPSWEATMRDWFAALAREQSGEPLEMRATGATRATPALRHCETYDCDVAPDVARVGNRRATWATPESCIRARLDALVTGGTTVAHVAPASTRPGNEKKIINICSLRLP